MRTLLVIAALLTTPLTNAAIILVEYTATVTAITGTGLGYSVDDAINGSFLIDPSLATADIAAADATVGFYKSTAGHDFIAGSPSPVTETLPVLDEYLVEDDRDVSGQFRDLFTVVDRERADASNDRFVFLQAFSYVTEFTSGDGLEQSFTLSDPTAFADGGFNGRLFDFVTGGTFNTANFDLSTLRVRLVPEPSGLGLLALGIAALGLSRRKRFL